MFISRLTHSRRRRPRARVRNELPPVPRIRYYS